MQTWLVPQINLREGDVALVIEPNSGRGEWPLERILETSPGSDGFVSVARVKMDGREFTRPVNCLRLMKYHDKE